MQFNYTFACLKFTQFYISSIRIMKGKSRYLVILSIFIFMKVYPQQIVNDSVQPATDPSRIIELANSVIALSDAHTPIYAHYDSLLGRAQKEISSFINNQGYNIDENLNITDSVCVDSLLFKNYKEQLQQITENFDGKERIVIAVNKADKSIYTLRESGRILYKYFTDKGYEKDSKNMLVFRELGSNLGISIDNAQNAWQEAVREAKIAANVAANVKIQEMSVGNLIVQIRNDMLSLRILTEDIFDESKHKDIQASKVQCNSLQRTFSDKVNNIGWSKNKLNKNKRKYYIAFYNSGYRLLSEIDSLIILVDEEKSKKQKMTYKKDRIFDNMEKLYKETVSNYNSFFM